MTLKSAFPAAQGHSLPNRLRTIVEGHFKNHMHTLGEVEDHDDASNIPSKESRGVT